MVAPLRVSPLQPSTSSVPATSCHGSGFFFLFFLLGDAAVASGSRASEGQQPLGSQSGQLAPSTRPLAGRHLTLLSSRPNTHPEPDQGMRAGCPRPRSGVGDVTETGTAASPRKQVT